MFLMIRFCIIFLLLSRLAQQYYMQVSSWMIKMDSELTRPILPEERKQKLNEKQEEMIQMDFEINQRTLLFLQVMLLAHTITHPLTHSPTHSPTLSFTHSLIHSLIHSLTHTHSLSPQGMLMGYTISNYIGTVLNLHSIYNRPMTKSSLLAICRMAELLKSIQYTFHRRSMTVTRFLNLSIDQFEIRILLILDATTVRYFILK